MRSAVVYCCQVTIVVLASSVATSSSSPSAPFSFSSTLFQKAVQQKTNHHKSILLQSSNTVNKFYARPPHDSRLYDTLHVRSNATLVEIQRSWRRLSREWHPDKVALRRRRRRRMRLGRENNIVSNENAEGGSHDSSPTNNNELDNINKNKNNNIGNSDADENSNNDDDDEEEEYARQKLAELTTAYEILSDDHTRLLYHRYGLIGGTDAAIQLLTGRMTTAPMTNNNNNLQQQQPQSQTRTTTSYKEEQGRLLELMGYPPLFGVGVGYSNTGSYHRLHQHEQQQQHEHPFHHSPPHVSTTSSSSSSQHQQSRLAYLTATITERLRPIVEGTISQDVFVDQVYREYSNLKKSPLGAHILRCIGRAYRIEGYRVLRTMHHDASFGMKKKKNIGGRRRRGGTTLSRNHHDHCHHYGETSFERRSNASHHHEVLADRVFDGWRDAKHYASAALASGKLVLMEQRIKKLEGDHHRSRQRQQQQQQQNEERHRQQRQRQSQRMNDDKVKRIQTSTTKEGKQEENFFASNIGALPGDEDSINDDADINDFHFGDDNHSVENIGAFSDDDDDDDKDFFNLLNNIDHNNDDGHHSQSEDEDGDNLEQELQHVQHKKIYSALLSAHQMEALWKITKIELDKIIREACRSILSKRYTSTTALNRGGEYNVEEEGWYAFCPSEESAHYSSEDWSHDYHHHRSSSPPPPPPPPPPSSHHRHKHQHHRRQQKQHNHHHHRHHRQHHGHYSRQRRPTDGWVGTTGEVVPLEVGRLRAAAALILVGDIMVQCSKEGTAWNKS